MEEFEFLQKEKTRLLIKFQCNSIEEVIEKLKHLIDSK